MEAVSVSRQRDRGYCGRWRGEKSAPQHRKRNSFLTSTITPKRGKELRGGETIVDDATFAHLEKVYKRYMKDRGVSNFYRLDKSVLDNDKAAVALLKAMQANANIGQRVELMRVPNGEASTIEFVLYEESKFYTWQIFVLPVNIIQRLQDNELRTIIKLFLAFLWKRTPFRFYNDEDYSETMYALQIDYFDDKGNPHFIDDMADNDPKYNGWCRRYVNGDIAELFADIEATAKNYQGDILALINDINKDIDYYIAKHDCQYYTTIHGHTHSTNELFGLIDEGIDLCNRGDIMEHTCLCLRSILGDDFDEYYGEEPFDFSELFMIGYSGTDDDPIMGEVFDCMNNSNERPNTPLINYNILGEQGSTYIDEDYPHKWETWFSEFYKAIND